MYGLELYSKVRMAVLRDGVSHRETARRFGIDRGTVSKIVGHSVPPGYRRSQPRVRPRLDAHAAFIDEVLKADLSEPKKQRHTILRLFERLRDERGFDGGYTTVRDYVRPRRLALKEAFAPLVHPAGPAQADFGEAWAVLGGVRQKVHVLVVDLPHSDSIFLKAYHAETAEALCDGHVAAFDFFGGVPLSILYDSSKDRGLIQWINPPENQTGGGEDPGRRPAGALQAVRGTAVALSVPRPLRPARQGQ
jgi:transposase